MFDIEDSFGKSNQTMPDEGPALGVDLEAGSGIGQELVPVEIYFSPANERTSAGVVDLFPRAHSKEVLSEEKQKTLLLEFRKSVYELYAGLVESVILPCALRTNEFEQIVKRAENQADLARSVQDRFINAPYAFFSEETIEILKGIRDSLLSGELEVDDAYASLHAILDIYDELELDLNSLN